MKISRDRLQKIEIGEITMKIFIISGYSCAGKSTVIEALKKLKALVLQRNKPQIKKKQ